MKSLEPCRGSRFLSVAIPLIFLLALSFCVSAPSLVTVSGTRLMVRKRLATGELGFSAPYFIRGVCYSPASITTATTTIDPDNATIRRQEFGEWFRTDIPLLRAINVNTVRLFIDPGFSGQLGRTGLAMLDEFWRNGIMVIMTVDNGINDTNHIASAVNFYKDHPAVLGWSLGSEWNQSRYFGVANSILDAAQRTENAARLIQVLDSAHPVVSSYGEIDIQSSGLRLADTKNYVNNVCPSVALWSLNVYRGRSFGNLFRQWASITSKPCFLGEFGIDAFRASALMNPNPPGTVNEDEQASWVLSLWNEISQHSSEKNATDVCVGGTVFEFCDEWWKISTPQRAGPSKHDTGGWFSGAFPDGMGNEEFFGIYTIDRTPRKLATMLTAAFDVIVLANPVFQDGQFSISFWSRPGRLYELESSEDIGDGLWTRVESITASEVQTTVSDANASGTQQFYRVKAD